MPRRGEPAAPPRLARARTSPARPNQGPGPLVSPFRKGRPAGPFFPPVSVVTHTSICSRAVRGSMGSRAGGLRGEEQRCGNGRGHFTVRPAGRWTLQELAGQGKIHQGQGRVPAERRHRGEASWEAMMFYRRDGTAEYNGLQSTSPPRSRAGSGTWRTWCRRRHRRRRGHGHLAVIPGSGMGTWPRCADPARASATKHDARTSRSTTKLDLRNRPPAPAFCQPAAPAKATPAPA